MPTLRYVLLGMLLVSGIGGRADVLYVSSYSTDKVLRFDPLTGAYIDTFVAASAGTGLSLPHGILDRGTDVLVASAGNDRVLRYDRTGGSLLGEFIGPGSGIDYPVAMIEGPDGGLYVSSQLSDEVLRFDMTTGALLGAFVTAGSGGLDGPSGLAFGPDGRLYVASRFSGAVLAYDGVTGAFDEIIADANDGLGAGVTFGLAFGGNGDLYFASSGAVFRYEIATQSLVASAATGFPIGVATDPHNPAGGVIVATEDNLRRMDGVTNALSVPLLGPGATINTLNFFHYSRFVTVDLPGDFNADGVVDAADYTTWRDALADGVELANDPTPGVSASDYETWAGNYGAILSPTTSAVIVPEPLSATTLLFLLCGLVAPRR